MGKKTNTYTFYPTDASKASGAEGISLSDLTGPDLSVYWHGKGIYSDIPPTFTVRGKLTKRKMLEAEGSTTSVVSPHFYSQIQGAEIPGTFRKNTLNSNDDAQSRTGLSTLFRRHSGKDKSSNNTGYACYAEIEVLSSDLSHLISCNDIPPQGIDATLEFQRTTKFPWTLSHRPTSGELEIPCQFTKPDKHPYYGKGYVSTRNDDSPLIFPNLKGSLKWAGGEEAKDVNFECAYTEQVFKFATSEDEN
ncbi:uncharacterized protein L201_003444 [Kwoniella dendrophila CBS 6074]|uniref:NADH:ubiquinone oxidoreductase intermediate-associated protein 30 domain-containing protein n=1 Tax=Kwoniella dendrophila CBS 6074 TaxID=1295534 RepID=A0AAX4JUH6_9TREE